MSCPPLMRQNLSFGEDLNEISRSSRMIYMNVSEEDEGDALRIHLQDLEAFQELRNSRRGPRTHKSRPLPLQNVTPSEPLKSQGRRGDVDELYPLPDLQNSRQI